MVGASLILWALPSVAFADVAIPGVRDVPGEVVIEGLPQGDTRWVLYPLGSGHHEHLELQVDAGRASASFYSVVGTRLHAVPLELELPDCGWRGDVAAQETCEAQQKALFEGLPRSEPGVVEPGGVPEGSDAVGVQAVFRFVGMQGAEIDLKSSVREVLPPPNAPHELVKDDGQAQIEAERRRLWTAAWGAGLLGLALLVTVVVLVRARRAE